MPPPAQPAILGDVDQQREDYAELDLHPRRRIQWPRLPRLTAAFVCGVLGIGFKVGGDWWGGHGLCDLVFAVFVGTGLVLGWRTVRHP